MEPGEWYAVRDLAQLAAVNIDLSNLGFMAPGI
jgi:hypothetical protein